MKSRLSFTTKTLKAPSSNKELIQLLCFLYDLEPL